METLINVALQQKLRAELRRYQTRKNVLALVMFAVDLVVALGAAMLAVVVEPLWLKAVFAVVSGTVIGALFVLGHDAVHGSLTSSRRLNAVLSRLAFLPSLHNVTLWFIEHNRIHHLMPNVKGLNSWSPLSLDEYRALPTWSRALQRFYRSGVGMAPYYLGQRWWKHKFFPTAEVDPDLKALAWRDFALLLAWLALWLAILVWLGQLSGHASPLVAIVWGFALPFVIWNQFMGLTVLLQHTHPAVRWYRRDDDARDAGGQETRTVHVRFPRWYGLLGHEIMEHPAHHVNPTIPCYRLHSAQARLNEVLGTNAVVATFSPASLFAVVRKCKLYDYDRHLWLDFAGRPTSKPINLIRRDT
jgi:omega-6 fatty acid desaturase (delta-12 desaturase)